ncbi:hypothetical protein HDU96_003746, partial [Phlyctochytrium bullatum]
TKEELAKETVTFYGFVKKTEDVEMTIKKFEMANESIAAVETVSEAINVVNATLGLDGFKFPSCPIR